MSRSRSARVASLAVLALQLLLVGIAAVGYRGDDLGVTLNALGALAITLLPALLERDRRFRMHPALVLWMTVAVVVHTVGVLGAYEAVLWFDDVAHATSASVVAAVGYASARSLDVHSEHLRLTPWFSVLYLLAFVMAAGVVWELLEYAVDSGTAALGPTGTTLQTDLDDTVTDLVYDTVGALVVALFGTAHLTDLVGERP